MAVTQGLVVTSQRFNIGLEIKQLRVDPRNTTVPVYFESMTHKSSHQIFSLAALTVSLHNWKLTI